MAEYLAVNETSVNCTLKCLKLQYICEGNCQISVFVHVRMCVCVCVCALVHACMHACVCACVPL